MVYFSQLRRYRSFRRMFRLRLARRILPVGQLKWAFTEAHSFASKDLASIDGVLGHGFKSLLSARSFEINQLARNRCELSKHRSTTKSAEM